jgi:hypothetical protein
MKPPLFFGALYLNLKLWFYQIRAVKDYSFKALISRFPFNSLSPMPKVLINQSCIAFSTFLPDSLPTVFVLYRKFFESYRKTTLNWVVFGQV